MTSHNFFSTKNLSEFKFICILVVLKQLELELSQWEFLNLECEIRRDITFTVLQFLKYKKFI